MSVKNFIAYKFDNQTTLDEWLLEFQNFHRSELANSLYCAPAVIRWIDNFYTNGESDDTFKCSTVFIPSFVFNVNLTRCVVWIDSPPTLVEKLVKTISAKMTIKGTDICFWNNMDKPDYVNEEEWKNRSAFWNNLYESIQLNKTNTLTKHIPEYTMLDLLFAHRP